MPEYIAVRIGFFEHHLERIEQGTGFTKAAPFLIVEHVGGVSKESAAKRTRKVIAERMLNPVDFCFNEFETYNARYEEITPLE